MSSGMCGPPLNLKPRGRNCVAHWMKAAVLVFYSALPVIKFCSMVCHAAPPPAKKTLQLLITSGIASIHFSPALTQSQFARFVRAFPSGNAKATSLAEQLKASLAGETGIKVNEIRYVAEDSSVAGIKTAANLAAKVLGATGDKFQDLFNDPNRLLQMILAAESSRGGAGGSPGTPGSKGSGGDGPSRGSGGTELWESRGSGSGGGAGPGAWSGTGNGRGGGFGSGGGAGSGTGPSGGTDPGLGSGSGSDAAG